MFDEYIPPYCIGDYAGMVDGDCVVHTNYRQDRAIQLTRAFVDAGYAGRLRARPRVCYVGLTRYYDEFDSYLMGAMDEGGGMDKLLGEVISAAGVRQLRIAETQKFRHVTSFFNGKSTKPYKGEDQVEVPGRFDPATFASHPEMDAYTVTEELLKRLEGNPYGFIAVNYANGDMVGHTGDFDAARKAIEVVDDCVGRVMKRFAELDAHVLVTADHGNSDEMIDYETGMVKTSHTMNPVECIYVARDAAGRRLRARGKLADVAPTVLHLMGLPVPSEMTAQNLLLA
jgi:2,3-bisphosphoglycerate-independent phosphoglycerate mutase